METWPSVFPAPSGNFTGNVKTSLVVTTMDSGRKRRRRRNSRSLRTFKASWQMSDIEYGMFQSWHKRKISDGADAFTIALPTGGDGLKSVTAAFADGDFSAVPLNNAVGFWNVTASLEVEEAAVWSEEIFDALLAVGGDVDALEAAAAHLGNFVNN